MKRIFVIVVICIVMLFLACCNKYEEVDLDPQFPIKEFELYPNAIVLRSSHDYVRYVVRKTHAYDVQRFYQNIDDIFFKVDNYNIKECTGTFKDKQYSINITTIDKDTFVSINLNQIDTQSMQQANISAENFLDGIEGYWWVIMIDDTIHKENLEFFHFKDNVFKMLKHEKEENNLTQIDTCNFSVESNNLLKLSKVEYNISITDDLLSMERIKKSDTLINYYTLMQVQFSDIQTIVDHYTSVSNLSNEETQATPAPPQPTTTTYKLECFACKGDGKCACGDGYLMNMKCLDCGGDAVCRWCDGLGYTLTVKQVYPENTNADDSNLCDICKGRGICMVCKGAGQFYIAGYGDGGQYITCEGCDGDRKCEYCGGTGKKK